jgi:DNA-binding LacI/PurR family transcriptional regulator
MKSLRIRSSSEQLADFLRMQIQERQWTETMPGESWLVSKLQVGCETVRAAMMQLESEGILSPCGQGKRRQLTLNRDAFARRNIRVRIFLFEKIDRGRLDSSILIAELLAAGIDADFTSKSLKELDMKVNRVARYVKENPADAWVVCAASREVIEWFAEQSTPAMAMYGSSHGLKIAAAYPMMIPGQTTAVRRLIELKHKRIVMLAREERRKPKPSLPEQAFLDELESAGIKTGDYNLPDWEESRDGLRHLVDELLRFSPPTAFIFQEAEIYIAVKSHLADKGFIAPRDISLVVADSDPSFAWCHPIPSHICWDYRPVVRLVVQWVKRLAQGKADQRKISVASRFVEGGTIGPAFQSKTLRR